MLSIRCYQLLVTLVYKAGRGSNYDLDHNRPKGNIWSPRVWAYKADRDGKIRAEP